MNLTTNKFELSFLAPQRSWHLELWELFVVFATDFILILHQLGYYLAILLIAYYVTGTLTYLYKMNFKARPNPIAQVTKRVLFVIAHPDDECMFFGPTIIRLRETCDLHLLCLTRGNSETRSQRKEELWDSCRVLGIPTQNITLMDIKRMPDDPSIIWNSRRTGRLLCDFIEAMVFHEVYSFDIGGVSGHLNHVSVFLGFAHMCLYNEVPYYCKVYILETVNKQRKYSVLADSFFSSLNKHMFMVYLEEAREIRNAMRKHKSQLTWYRHMYMYLSRYVYMNTYKGLEIEDVQLVIQMTDMNSLM